MTTTNDVVLLADAEIAALLAESKPLASDYGSSLSPKRIVETENIAHLRADLDVTGANGSPFRISVRQNAANALDFSVILMIQPDNARRWFRLRRYNGDSHEHTNYLEREAFRGFHVHKATERYQRIGRREDAWAEPTDRYSDLKSAMDCMIADCGFIKPADEARSGSIRREA